MINYSEAAATYNNSRAANPDVVRLFCQKVNFGCNTRVLDFGCGTGNYLARIAEDHRCKCFGLEPSDAMHSIAARKNPSAVIRKGDHGHIPYDPAFFDFVYMTDVIHHVADTRLLCMTIHRILKVRGLLCILTESWEQIEHRWYNRYFPSLIAIEKKRYPDLGHIIKDGRAAGFAPVEVQILDQPRESKITGIYSAKIPDKCWGFRKL